MKDWIPPPEETRRPPHHVMRLERMGKSFPSRLSFLRTLLRRLGTEQARVTTSTWEMDAQGYGHAVLSVPLGGQTYSLIALSQPLDAKDRSDRVIATQWDAAFGLVKGTPDAATLEMVRTQAPLQEAGQFDARVLVLSRANKSVRLWDHLVEALKNDQSPDETLVADCGYLMRTTAVYGNGKFNIADRFEYAHNSGLEGPFMAEMLTVYLIRAFTHALIEHVAQKPLPRDLKRRLGIGNATGLGMAPFLVSHPVLLNNWVMARETALARVLAVSELSRDEIAELQRLYGQATDHLEAWTVPDPVRMEEIKALRAEWADFGSAFEQVTTPKALYEAAAGYSEELQELLVALLLEPFGHLIDGLEECMADPLGAPPLDLSQDLQGAIARDWAWALPIDFSSEAETAQFWYTSEEKREPRIGQRYSEPGAELENPLDIARRVQAFAQDLMAHQGDLEACLTAEPAHMMAAERVALRARLPYSEIEDNLIAAGTQPIDMLRFKLAFFGATGFDPKSDLWTRITLYQGAPLGDELGQYACPWLPV
ncbi:MAG: hypothetical protein AAGD04_09530 [Pseudomonadota bacterium]